MRFSPETFARRGRLLCADVAYDAGRDMCFAALILWDVPGAKVIDQWSRGAPSTFPYVPGLLSLREIPPLLPLLRRVRDSFDLIVCDGQGIAHPRRFGLASHLGLLYDVPSLGWAKSRLTGRYREPGKRRGAASALLDGTEQVGWVLRSREACRPTFVSPGHAVSMDGSLALARLLLGRHRLCEPARAAHNLTRVAMQA